MKITVALLFGGKSVEHEISIISALQAAQSLNPEKYSVIPVYISKSGEMYCGDKIGDIEQYKDLQALLSCSYQVTFARVDQRPAIIKIAPKMFQKPLVAYIDVALPVVHGTNVEDGTIAGYLNMVGVPYAGCDVLSAALSMDKYAMKVIFKSRGIPVLDCVVLDSPEAVEDEACITKIEKKISYPMIVKPINLGSSVGISKANNREKLLEAIADAFLYAKKVIVERAITNLTEVNCSVLGNERRASASVCERPVGSDEILSYDDKYIGGSKGSKGMASTKRIIPADITDEQTRAIQDYAVKAFRALGCSGVSRIDFMIDNDTGEIFLNEINSIPGSLAFYLWEASGKRYEELLDEIISLALERDRQQSKITYAFNTNVLSGVHLKGAKGGKM